MYSLFIMNNVLVNNINDASIMNVFIVNTVSSEVGGSVAEWLACWTQAQNGPGSNRSREAVR